MALVLSDPFVSRVGASLPLLSGRRQKAVAICSPPTNILGGKDVFSHSCLARNLGENSATLSLTPQGTVSAAGGDNFVHSSQTLRRLGAALERMVKVEWAWVLVPAPALCASVRQDS